ncbi:MAG TPA: hypothetical protein VFN35_13980, partial [Ktedonobacteraceae bacterium]|nr:hypothetical protein [Ktedonobacteraceae bacterium]
EEADALAERIIVIDRGKVRADAAPATLKAEVSKSRITFDVSGAFPDNFFAQLPVLQLELEEGHVSLLTSKLEIVLRALFNQPVEITNLSVTGTSLEEAFLHLTHTPLPETERNASKS